MESVSAKRIYILRKILIEILTVLLKWLKVIVERRDIHYSKTSKIEINYCKKKIVG
jgi:hypothetical protein